MTKLVTIFHSILLASASKLSRSSNTLIPIPAAKLTRAVIEGFLTPRSSPDI